MRGPTDTEGVLKERARRQLMMTPRSDFEGAFRTKLTQTDHKLSKAYILVFDY